MGRAGRRFSLAVVAVAATLAAGRAQAGPLGWGPASRAGALAPCATATRAPKNPPADLRLVWVDVAGVARLAYPEAEREVLTLLGRMGVRASMRRGDVHGISDASELTIIVLPDAPKGGRLEHGVMGATRRSPEGVRAMWVYAKSVGATLGLDPGSPSFWSLPQRRQFGVALGRVVVHEIVHAVAPHRPHARVGIMAERMGRAQLVQPRLEIDAVTAKAVRESLDGTAVRPAGVAGVATGLSAPPRR